MSKDIKAIHPFGPPVGKWTVHATVAETIKRARRELEEQKRRAAANEQETVAKVQSIVRGKT